MMGRPFQFWEIQSTQKQPRKIPPIRNSENSTERDYGKSWQQQQQHCGQSTIVIFRINSPIALLFIMHPLLGNYEPRERRGEENLLRRIIWFGAASHVQRGESKADDA